MIRFVLLFLSLAPSFALKIDVSADTFIGYDLDLYDENAQVVTINLSESMEDILEDARAQFGFFEGSSGERSDFLKVSFVIDKYDSIFSTSLKKFVPGATLAQLQTSEKTFVDFELYFHHLFEVEHYPSKVVIDGKTATVTPIFP